MSLNYEEINKILNGLSTGLLIRKVTEEEYGCFYLHCMNLEEKSIIIQINLHDGESGLFIVPPEVAVPEMQHRFSSFLSNRLSGGRIESVSQPDNCRIVVFNIRTISQPFYLIARLWGTASNLLLTDSHFVIEELARRYPKREEWVGDTFFFPLPQKNQKTFSIRDTLVKNNINDDLFYYYQHQRTQKEFSLLQKRLVCKLEAQITEQAATVNHLQRETDSKHAEELRHFGELLTANLYQIKKGAPQAEVEDYETGNIIIIPLNPELSPQENCKRYFDKYKKLQSTAVYQTQRLNECLFLLDEAETLLSSVKKAVSLDSLKEIAILAGENNETKINGTTHKTAGRKFLLSGGFVAYVSKSSKDADVMLKTIARGNDYWFHLRDNAGSHVVVKNRGNVELPDKTRLEAAMLALYFSKSRDETEGDIYFTRIKYLHKPNTNTPGLVFPTQEKNIKIRKQPDILTRLLSGNMPSKHS